MPIRPVRRREWKRLDEVTSRHVPIETAALASWVVLYLVRASDFGRGERGAVLTAEIERFLEDGRLVLTADISGEALYRKELCAAPVLYVGVYGCPRGYLLPDRSEIAERLYHEALHSVKRSDR